LRIEIPEQYPIRPPVLAFATPVCHPNVRFETGEICLDILTSQWSPAWTLTSTCLAVHVLLANPEPSSPLNCDAANLLRCGDGLGYRSLVALYTRLFAHPLESH
ncbi:E2 ubiquitin-protein ligase peroxin 4, partial [Coemansia nantahalensis]